MRVKTPGEAMRAMGQKTGSATENGTNGANGTAVGPMEDEGPTARTDERDEEEAGKPHPLHRVIADYNADPSRWSCIRVHAVRKKGASRGKWVGSLDLDSIYEIEETVSRAEWGGGGFWDVTLWDAREGDWSSWGRIETDDKREQPADRDQADDASEDSPPAWLEQLLAGGKPDDGTGGLIGELLGDLVRANLGSRAEMERRHAEELRESRRNDWEAARDRYKADRNESMVSALFEGMTKLTREIGSLRRQRIDDSAPVVEDKQRDTLLEFGRTLLRACKDRWPPVAVLGALEASFGEKETRKLFAELDAALTGAAERVPGLSDALKDTKNEKWLSATLEHFVNAYDGKK